MYYLQVRLSNFQTFIQQNLPLLDRTIAVDSAFTSTTGRLPDTSETVERSEFLPLLLHTFYTNDIDCRFIAKTGQSRLDNSAHRIKTFEAREFLSGCGFKMTDAQLQQEFAAEGGSDSAADGVTFAGLCKWYVGSL